MSKKKQKKLFGKSKEDKEPEVRVGNPQVVRIIRKDGRIIIDKPK